MKLLILSLMTLMSLSSNSYAAEFRTLECALYETAFQKPGCDRDCDDTHTTIQGVKYVGFAAVGEGAVYMRLEKLGTGEIVASSKAAVIRNQPNFTYRVDAGNKGALQCWVSLK